jgi:uncharacterized RDD family membrane protein YckC
MKCPKCQYIGFDTGDRCRNCGYEFALLLKPAGGAAAGARDEPLDLDLTLRAPLPDTGPSATPALPLFEDDDEMDVPLVRTAPPRQPIAVRKTPEAQRQHLARTVSADTPLPSLLEPVAESLPPRARPEPPDPLFHRPVKEPVPVTEPPPMLDDAPVETAAVGSRLVAGIIDFGLLLGIDFVVLHFTLRLTALTFAEWRMIPLAPLLCFLVGVKLAYLVTFTLAGGQTIGKMAVGLRVVSDESRQLAPWDAVRRALVEVASVAVCGLPFLFALADPSRRGLHDRVARTRVVPAS